MEEEKDTGWTCCYCTLENEAGCPRCAACNADRPSAALVKMFAKQATITWTCVKCGRENSGHRVSCVKCRTTGSWMLSGPGTQPEHKAHTETQLKASSDICKESAHKARTEQTTHVHGTNSSCNLSTETVQTTQPEHTKHVTSASSKVSPPEKEPVSGDFCYVDSLTQSTASSAPYTPEDELRIVLLGRTGEGKSTTGNTILGSNIFTSSLSSVSVTRICQRGTRTRQGRYVQVIDTPGMYDTEMSIPDITREVVRCVGMTAPGPHAFVLVTRPDRFTEEVQNSVDHYVKMFGEGMLRYLIIIFTRRDDLIYSGKTIEEYIAEDSGRLQDLVVSCNSRYLTFNNRGTPEEKEEDVVKLVRMIDETVATNRGVYTSGMYREAEQLLLQNEERLRREHEEQMEEERQQIREECERQLREKEEEYSELIHQYQIQLEGTRGDGDSGGTRALRKMLHDMRAQQKLELQRIRDIAGRKQDRVNREKVNYREQTREDINKGSDFVTEKLIPGLITFAKIVLPPLIMGGLALLKR